MLFDANTGMNMRRWENSHFERRWWIGSLEGWNEDVKKL